MHHLRDVLGADAEVRERRPRSGDHAFGVVLGRRENLVDGNAAFPGRQYDVGEGAADVDPQARGVRAPRH